MSDEPEPRDETDDEGPVESPPDESTCAEHPERPALAVCPRCGSHACLACWHHTIRRCHACLMRDPASVAPPIPWEQPRRDVISRWLATLAAALRPIATAPAFARDDIASARSFWLTTFLPFAVLAGIVPYTHTLHFGPSFAVLEIGSPGPTELAIDVARAAGIGLVVALVAFVALALPFVSLSRAYAEKGYASAPLRAVLYRSWLLPAGRVLESVLAWSLPDPPSQEAILIVQLGAMLPLVLLFWALRATARMAAGVGPLAAYAVALVPFVVMIFVDQLLGRALEPLMPDPEVMRRALDAMRGGGS